VAETETILTLKNRFAETENILTLLYISIENIFNPDGQAADTENISPLSDR
jgi:hypothetical protein